MLNSKSSSCILCWIRGPNYSFTHSNFLVPFVEETVLSHIEWLCHSYQKSIYYECTCIFQPFSSISLIYNISFCHYHTVLITLTLFSKFWNKKNEFSNFLFLFFFISKIFFAIQSLLCFYINFSISLSLSGCWRWQTWQKPGCWNFDRGYSESVDCRDYHLMKIVIIIIETLAVHAQRMSFHVYIFF